MTVEVLVAAVDTWTENSVIQACARTVLRRLGEPIHYHTRLVSIPIALGAAATASLSSS